MSLLSLKWKQTLCAPFLPPKNNTHQTNKKPANISFQDFVNPNPLNVTSHVWQSISFALNSRLRSEHFLCNSTHIIDILCYKHQPLFLSPFPRMLLSVLILSLTVRLSLAIVINNFKWHWFYIVKFYFNFGWFMWHRRAVVLPFKLTQQSCSTNSTGVLVYEWVKLYKGSHCLTQEMRYATYFHSHFIGWSKSYGPVLGNVVHSIPRILPLSLLIETLSAF